MSNIVIKDPADRLDLSYAFANNYAALGKDPDPLVEMSRIAKEIAPGVSARCALVHPAEIRELVSLLEGSSVRPEVLIDFADGMGGVETKKTQARFSKEAGAIGGDLVINLHAVQKRDKKTLLEEILAVSNYLETKSIVQIPYLWQYDREAIPWLIDVLSEGGVYCVKDWTTRENFLLPDGDTLDYTHDTRLKYIEYMSEFISQHNLPLALKVAGRVTADNVASFINAGATLIGTSYRKAAALRKALL
jgi:deoxyribose-phosphate aldolase